MKKDTQKRKASKIKNEYILVLEAISKVIKTDLTKKIDNNIQRKKENAPTNSKDAFGLTKSIAEYF